MATLSAAPYAAAHDISVLLAALVCSVVLSAAVYRCPVSQRRPAQEGFGKLCVEEEAGEPLGWAELHPPEGNAACREWPPPLLAARPLSREEKMPVQGCADLLCPACSSSSAAVATPLQ